MGELAVVAIALVLVVSLTGGGWIEAIGAAAVLASFGHAQVAERMREREARKLEPDVACHRWSLVYFIAKELFWLGYFVAHRSWAALVGVGLFLAYPLWRKWWRSGSPQASAWAGPILCLNGREFRISGFPTVHLGTPWHAKVCIFADSCDERDCLRHLTEAADAASFLLNTGSGSAIWIGKARPAKVTFFDDPLRRGLTCAALELFGEGRLETA